MKLRTTLARSLAVGVSALLVCATTPVHAAPHAVDPRQAAGRLLEQAQTRHERIDLFQKALTQPEVRSQASSMGVDAEKIAAAIPHLSDAELADLAQRASQVNDVAAGHRGRRGSNVGLVLFGTALLVTAIVVLAVAVGDDYHDDYYDDDYCDCW